MDSMANPTYPQFESAFHSSEKVQGYTHDFYRYPARFSPHFVRFFLDALTEPGDCVLDPFMGGGTTIVEAAASGRYAIGSDVNRLSRFVAEVKTTPLSERDVSEVRKWVQAVSSEAASLDVDPKFAESPIRNVPGHVHDFLATATKLVENLRFRRRRRFARCVLLSIGQWALDSSSTIPNIEALVDKLDLRTDQMLSGLRKFTEAAREWGIQKNRVTGKRSLLSYSASNGLLARVMHRRGFRPKLVLTSPPYPGVHMLYHRWQVMGRRETPAPYWLADVKDGHGASFYTMGSRSPAGVDKYFTRLTTAYTNIRRVVAPDARVVQLVAFSDTESQLPRFLGAMADAGFEETSVGQVDSQQARLVPNRKWYNQARPFNDASREVLLVHRPLT